MCILLHLSKSNVLQFFAFTEEVYELLTVKLYSILNLHSICNKTWYFLVLMIKNNKFLQNLHICHLLGLC